MKTKLVRIKKDIETLATFTATPSRGVTRLPFTVESRKAKKYIEEEMLKAGLNVRQDGVGTLIGRLDGNDPKGKVVMIGSHIDTVKNGGAFDGIAGVVAALEVARVMKEQNVRNFYSLEVVAMDDEEGVRFERGMLSSRAMAGQIEVEELDNLKDEEGFTLRECMEKCGIKPNPDKAKRSDIKAFIELHIEQGPILEMKNKDIGIVEKIVGIQELKVIVKGSAGHAGTTPMNMRKDALVAASHIIAAINNIAVKIDNDAVATVGKIDVLPGAPNVIPEIVEFTIDMRSHDEKIIEQIKRNLEDFIKRIKSQFNVNIELVERSYKEPVNLSYNISKLIEKEAKGLGFSIHKLPSGAGHDAMVMTDIAETGMIFVPSKKGISHRPDEWTDFEKLQKGVETLFNVVKTLCCNK